MADASLRELEGAIAGRYDAPEMQLARPLIELQAKWSAVPTRTALVVESLRSREGRHLFVYPFAGRHAHLGLASLLAYRIGQGTPSTFSIAINDYGFELLSPVDIDWMGAWQRRSETLLGDTDLLDDVLASLNAGELALRRFREVARIAGLVFQGFPGAPKSMKQLQASSGPVLRGIPQVRRRQPSARPGGARSARAGAGHRSPARDAHAHAGAAHRLPPACAPVAVCISADGRTPARAGDDGKTRPRESSACSPNSNRRPARTYKILCDHVLLANI